MTETAPDADGRRPFLEVRSAAKGQVVTKTGNLYAANSAAGATTRAGTLLLISVVIADSFAGNWNATCMNRGHRHSGRNEVETRGRGAGKYQLQTQGGESPKQVKTAVTNP